MRVLLIDDDALVRQTLGDALAAEGIEVDGLACAEDALVLLGAGQAPDVLVAAIDLGPSLRGLDLAAIARERHPGVEVVLISGTRPARNRQALGRRERFLRQGSRMRTLRLSRSRVAKTGRSHQRSKDPGFPNYSAILEDA
jgi:DNA-binding NtrC family response regulator